MLRRYQINAEHIIQLGNLTLNDNYMEVQVDHKTMTLPKKEFQLLYMLTSHPKQVFYEIRLLKRCGDLIMREMSEL